MSRSETTVAQYRACVIRGVCSPTILRDSFGTQCHWGQRDRHLMPMVVNWVQADTFCRWAVAVFRRNWWEYTARMALVHHRSHGGGGARLRSCGDENMRRSYRLQR